MSAPDATPADRLAAVLAEHYPNPVWCKCGWRAPLSLNDPKSDCQQTRAHVAAACGPLLADVARDAAVGALREAADEWSEFEVFAAADGFRSLRMHDKDPGDWLIERADRLSEEGR